MAQFYKSKNDKLLRWAGVIQKTAIKSLFSKDDFENFNLNQLIPFCFPTEQPISGPLTYVFRFTTSNKFYNVFCLLDQTSFQLRDLDTNQQCCICIISEYYHFDLYDEALKIARSLLLHSVQSAEHFFETLYSNPASLTGMQTMPKILNPSSNHEQFIAQMIQPLSNNFSPEQIGEIILALLCDTPFIVTSSDLSLLTQFCYSLFALVDPLEWRHIFAPVLPSNILETVQSPAPFIVGVHKYLVPHLSLSDIEAHFHINLDNGTIGQVNIPQMPSWALQLCNAMKEADVRSIHQLILRLICSSLGIHPSSSPSTTARRILSAVKTSKFETGSVVFQLINSRTTRCFFDSLKEKPIPQNYINLLGSCVNSGITSPAAQEVDEFPLRKVQVLRSSSVQFHRNKPTGPRSVSIPNIRSEDLSKSKLHPSDSSSIEEPIDSSTT